MFITRAISALTLLAIVVVLFIFGGYPLAGALLLISCIGFWELSKALANPNAEIGAERAPLPNKKKVDSMDIIGMVGIVFYYVAMVFFKQPVYQFCIVIIFIMAILFVYVFSFPKIYIGRISNVAFSFIYCPVMLSFIYMVKETENYGDWLIWLVLISSWGCDTFAYLFGVAFGKRKIFPVLSPNKSLAGCIGGLVSSAVLGGLYGYFYVAKVTGRPYIFIVTAIMCLVGGLMGMIGDLVASGIKRNKGFKDYAKLIPGHGGIMDRFDSTIITAAAVYALSIVLVNQNF